MDAEIKETDELEPYLLSCDYCGSEYDDSDEGHAHDEDCECEYCESHDERFMGYGFCGPDCETHFVREGLHKTKERRYRTRLEESGVSN